MTDIKASDFEHHEGRAYVVSYKPERSKNGYSVGWYQSHHGLVRVTIHPVGDQAGNANGITSLIMNYGGIAHHRIWRCIWSDRKITELARAFANDVADKTRDRSLLLDNLHRHALGPADVEPTEAMVAAGSDAITCELEAGEGWHDDLARACWDAMIKAKQP